MRAEDDPATGVVRGSFGSLAGVASAFLAVGLLATARYLTTGPRIVRPLASVGFLGHHRLVDDRPVRLDAEDAIVQVDAAHDVAAEVEHVGLHAQ